MNRLVFISVLLALLGSTGKSLAAGTAEDHLMVTGTLAKVDKAGFVLGEPDLVDGVIHGSWAGFKKAEKDSPFFNLHFSKSRQGVFPCPLPAAPANFLVSSYLSHIFPTHNFW